MACKLKSWKCFMKTLPEVATVAGIFRTNDCFKDLPDTKLDGFPCPAAVSFLPHPPCHQLHAAQRNIRPSVTHRSEETFEVETLHNNSSNRQALCKVSREYFLFFSPLILYFQQFWVSSDEEKLHRLDMHLGKTHEITNVQGN